MSERLVLGERAACVGSFKVSSAPKQSQTTIQSVTRSRRELDRESQKWSSIRRALRSTKMELLPYPPLISRYCSRSRTEVNTIKMAFHRVMIVKRDIYCISHSCSLWGNRLPPAQPFCVGRPMPWGCRYTFANAALDAAHCSKCHACSC